MGISRRKFLGILGAGAGTLAGADALAAENFEGYPDRYGMLTDVTRCIGCRSCEKGCNEYNDLPAPDRPFEDLSVLDEHRRTTSEAYTIVNRYQPSNGGEPVFRKHQCNHCNEPACVSACFVKALEKTKEGPVIYHPELCVGCRYCLVSCPFYAPAYEYHEPFTPRVMKCHMCFEKFTKQGGGAPACAEACPMEAISFGKRNDLLSIAHERIRKEPDRYVGHVYGEHEVGGLSWMYLSGVPFNEVGLETDIGTSPYPKYTKGALASVPVIIMLWPVLLGGVYYMTKRRDQIAAQTQADAVSNAIAETTDTEKEKAEKAKENALKRQKSGFDRDKKKEIKTAVDEAVEKTKQEYEQKIQELQVTGGEEGEAEGGEETESKEEDK